jgi:hypothetical protein
LEIDYNKTGEKYIGYGDFRDLDYDGRSGFSFRVLHFGFLEAAAR